MKDKQIIEVLDNLINKEITFEEARDKLFVLYGVMFSEARAKVCKDTSAWKDCESWKKDFKCLKNCSLHLQT